MFQLGRDRKFVAVPVYETDNDDSNPAQVVVTRPYGISKADQILLASPRVLGVRLGWFDYVDSVSCYFFQDNVMIEFATWTREDSASKIKVKESLIVPKASLSSSLAPIKVRTVQGDRRIITKANDLVIRQLCVQSERKYRGLLKAARI